LGLNLSIMPLAIYSLTINNQMYVGSSVNIRNRIAQHKFLSKSCASPVYKFIRENGGWNNVEVNIHFYSYTLGKAEALSMEALFIEYIKPSLNNNKVNLYLSKKDYDKQRYITLKNITCPCCNKLMTEGNMKKHRKTKRYLSYEVSVF